LSIPHNLIVRRIVYNEITANHYYNNYLNDDNNYLNDDNNYLNDDNNYLNDDNNTSEPTQTYPKNNDTFLPLQIILTTKKQEEDSFLHILKKVV
jgi:hypothetical protein